jgi:hypothetical protein
MLPAIDGRRTNRRGSDKAAVSFGLSLVALLALRATIVGSVT